MSSALLTTAETFATAIARGLSAAHVEIAAQWLAKLHELLSQPIGSVFPTTSLLDHIPDLIGHIADDLASPAEHALVTNTAVMTKAQELGDLRFQQQASVHQILREYRLLAEVMSDFVTAEVERLGLQTRSADALRVAARLHESVLVLMQTTVDRFVARYADKAAQQNQRLQGFNRMVTHELRQPLGTIVSAIGLLRRDDTPRDTHERCVELIETNARRMATLTTKLLSLSSLDVDSPQTQAVDLGKVVDDTAAQVRELAERRGVSIKLSVPSIRIVTDIGRVELILINLLSNAIKYCDPSKADRFVEVAAAEELDGVCVTVTDNGLGIPQDHLGRVFEGFYRAHAARDRELDADGIGLGLAIVAECARHLDAALDIASDEGRGTTLSVHLRATPAAAG